MYIEYLPCIYCIVKENSSSQKCWSVPLLCMIDEIAMANIPPLTVRVHPHCICVWPAPCLSSIVYIQWDSIHHALGLFLFILFEVNHSSIKYCKLRIFSSDRFSLISPSKTFHSFNFHYSMAIPFYVITNINILEPFNFHRVSSSAEIVKTNHRWNCLVLQYPIHCHFSFRNSQPLCILLPWWKSHGQLHICSIECNNMENINWSDLNTHGWVKQTLSVLIWCESSSNHL